MIYNNCEFGYEFTEIIEYLNSLSNMSLNELKYEIKDYKKVINTLIRSSNNEHIKYFVCSKIFNILNKLSSNSYTSILNDLYDLKSELLFEKYCIKVLKKIIKLDITSYYQDIDCFYLTLCGITKLHNNRCLYFNNLIDVYSSNFKGINVILPDKIDYNNQELKSNINNSLNILVQKIK